MLHSEHVCAFRMTGMADSMRITSADDAMAILSAFNSNEVEVIGLTTLFGNVPVAMATDNALLLRHIVSEHDQKAGAVPVCPGSSTSFVGEDRHRIADFVHGSDGFGDKRPALPQAGAP